MNRMEDVLSAGARTEGWGIDADRDNDPTYPMRRRLDTAEERSGWTRPAQQPIDVEVLHSNERPDLTAVFGTSTPPSGLSGIIRRAAFAYSESSYLHWLPLVLADRINVVEGVLDDVKRGRIPNPLAEAGGRAKWRYDRRRTIDRLLFTAAIAAISVTSVRAYRAADRAKRGEAR
jgi:hypothetical protein